MKPTISRLEETVPLTGFTLTGVLAALSAIAWLAVSQSNMPMAGMVDTVAFGLFTAIWGIGMVAMMFPSLVPMVYAMIASTRKTFEERLVSPLMLRTAIGLRSGLFIAGYVAVWTLVGVAFYLTIAIVAQTSLPVSIGSFDLWAGLILLGTGLYQFSPWKQEALSKCRSPMGFVLTRWRNRGSGALVMGADYGLFCTRCCWVLMAGLLTVGAMSLPLMGLFSIIIFAEKILPFGQTVSKLVGLAFMAVAVILLV